MYKPTEYEQMLISAGWVTPESLDNDYLDYQRRVKADDIGYSDWSDLVREYEQLDTEYAQKVNPYYERAWAGEHYFMPLDVQNLELTLLKRMEHIETVLAY